MTRAYDRIQYSNRPDLQKKSRKKSNIVGTIIEQAKKLITDTVDNNENNIADIFIAPRLPILVDQAVMPTPRGCWPADNILHNIEQFLTISNNFTNNIGNNIDQYCKQFFCTVLHTILNNIDK